MSGLVLHRPHAWNTFSNPALYERRVCVCRFPGRRVSGVSHCALHAAASPEVLHGPDSSCSICPSSTGSSSAPAGAPHLVPWLLPPRAASRLFPVCHLGAAARRPRGRLGAGSFAEFLPPSPGWPRDRSVPVCPPPEGHSAMGWRGLRGRSVPA